MPTATNWHEETKIKYIFAHEYTHICRLDFVWKALFAVILCLHWFNPFVWLMFVVANRDIELSCDEAVLKLLGNNTKHPYALMLLDMAESSCQPAISYTGFSKFAIEERIQVMINMKKKRILSTVLLVALMAIMAACSATHPVPVIDEPAGILVGAASCRPQVCMTDKDNDLTQARAAECRPYENNIDFYPVSGGTRPEFLAHQEYHSNPEIIGHLHIPGTTIDYLITQAPDNIFYLYHNINRQRHTAGWIWLCAYNDISRQDQNLVLFGHNMARNHMFHSLRFFLEEDFFLNNRYIHFSTIYADYVFEIFSAYVTHTSFPYIEANYDHMQGGWEYWINAFAQQSLFDAGIAVSEDDRIITLSTCESRRRDYRIVVQGRLIA